ncbi:hypothetical protein CUW27_20780 [Salmonella enterica]|nr:hypothetical protein [Salmonella enterica]
MISTSAAKLRLISDDELNERRLFLAALALDPAALACPVEDLPALIAQHTDTHNPEHLRGMIAAAMACALERLFPGGEDALP